MHWTTPAATRAELAAAGLEVVDFYETDGSMIAPDPEGVDSPYFHLVARRAP